MTPSAIEPNIPSITEFEAEAFNFDAHPRNVEASLIPGTESPDLAKFNIPVAPTSTAPAASEDSLASSADPQTNFPNWREYAHPHESVENASVSSQVIIAGGGPVGLFTAIVLASYGIHTHVLEALPEISDSPRAAAYQPAVLSELIEADVYHALRAVADESSGLTYWRDNSPDRGVKMEKEEIKADDKGVGKDKPGGQNDKNISAPVEPSTDSREWKKRLAVLPKIEGVQGITVGLNCGQPTLAKVLLAKLKTYANVRFLFDAQVIDVCDSGDSDIPVRVTYRTGAGETNTLTCDWLIGADGSRSTVRKLMGIDFEGFTWPKEEFVATNVIYPFKDFGFTSGNFFIHPVHWAVVAAINETQQLWRIAYGTRPGMSVEEITAEIPQRFNHFLPDPNVHYELLQVNPYKVHQRCATQFRKGRVLLVGDAAHSNNPIGGLGLTGGLLDAGPLARALAAVIHGRAPDSLLDKWAKLRHQTFWQYTNPQSIEYKRVIQQGGYGDDPVQIWAHDETAKSMGMLKWLQNATPEAKQRDEAMFTAMLDADTRLRAAARSWTIALPVDWMAEYEDANVVAARRATRPEFNLN